MAQKLILFEDILNGAAIKSNKSLMDELGKLAEYVFGESGFSIEKAEKKADDIQIWSGDELYKALANDYGTAFRFKSAFVIEADGYVGPVMAWFFEPDGAFDDQIVVLTCESNGLFKNPRYVCGLLISEYDLERLLGEFGGVQDDEDDDDEDDDDDEGEDDEEDFKVVDGKCIFPKGVKEIPDDAFCEEQDIVDVEIPESVEVIGESAFFCCKGLRNVKINGPLKRICSSAFYGCDRLISINIPATVTIIDEEAFSWCKSLERLVIPDSVIEIGNDAFSDCSSLTEIKVSSGNRRYDSRDGCNAIIETDSNTLIVGCKNTVIPATVTIIGEDAFSGCSSLERLVIPDSVAEIGDDAFSYCSNLTEIIVSSANQRYDSRDGCNAIIETKTNTLITGSKNTLIPNSVTKIDDCAFRGLSNLSEIGIPDSVKEIGGMAFCDCNSLERIYIKNAELLEDTELNDNVEIITEIDKKDKLPPPQRTQREYIFQYAIKATVGQAIRDLKQIVKDNPDGYLDCSDPFGNGSDYFITGIKEWNGIVILNCNLDEGDAYSAEVLLEELSDFDENAGLVLGWGWELRNLDPEEDGTVFLCEEGEIFFHYEDHDIRLFSAKDLSRMLSVFAEKYPGRNVFCKTKDGAFYPVAKAFDDDGMNYVVVKKGEEAISASDLKEGFDDCYCSEGGVVVSFVATKSYMAIYAKNDAVFFEEKVDGKDVIAFRLGETLCDTRLEDPYDDCDIVSDEDTLVTVENLDERVTALEVSAAVELARASDPVAEVKPSKPVPKEPERPQMEYVDLGLSVKWAKWNLGAKAPEEKGDYFCWGELSPKSEYEWNNYRFRKEGRIAKYSTKKGYGEVDNLKQLELPDDAAHQVLGGGWRMPTMKEAKELKDNCSFSRMTINGVKGCKATSKIKGYTDKWIFFPNTGYKGSDKILLAQEGFYWTSSLYTRRPDSALTVFCNYVKEGIVERDSGLAIRPVTK